MHIVQHVYYQYKNYNKDAYDYKMINLRLKIWFQKNEQIFGSWCNKRHSTSSVFRSNNGTLPNKKMVKTTVTRKKKTNKLSNTQFWNNSRVIYLILYGFQLHFRRYKVIVKCRKLEFWNSSLNKMFSCRLNYFINLSDILNGFSWVSTKREINLYNLQCW